MTKRKYATLNVRIEIDVPLKRALRPLLERLQRIVNDSRHLLLEEIDIDECDLGGICRALEDLSAAVRRARASHASSGPLDD
jgi:hypothetical protein